MARCSSPENYYFSGRNTELELCRLWSIYRWGNRQTNKSGFRQCKTIIMPLIPISYSSVSCCRRCLRCAKRCSFCSAVSCWRLLLQFVVHAEFEVGILQRIFISQTTDSHFANYRFSSRKLQIFISFRSISFRFVSFRSISFRKLQ